MKSLNFNRLNIQKEDVLSITQMKQILGGTATGKCSSGSCTVYDSSTGITYPGTCGEQDLGGGLEYCECLTDLGLYTPNGGQSSCYTA